MSHAEDPRSRGVPRHSMPLKQFFEFLCLSVEFEFDKFDDQKLSWMRSACSISGGEVI